jgi:hypothetical protein
MKLRFDRERAEQLEALETDWGPDQILGRNYEADKDLEAAVNVSLILSRPLLVSGAPGCGKTQLGYAIARNLGIERVYFFSVKSTSEARDLFYGYDAIGRFQAVQIAAAEQPFSDGGRSGSAPPRVGDYIEYRAGHASDPGNRHGGARGRARDGGGPSGQSSDYARGRQGLRPRLRDCRRQIYPETQTMKRDHRRYSSGSTSPRARRIRIPSTLLSGSHGKIAVREDLG